ncbi:uncharacterized protein LOC123318703 [Coccinella septempunctata]|uniref:uncharacterized protein LOC123318703 n=1 Tax=Coccinella septempunctata TaxID=41139 RepID=UPI001D08FE28|nr:uncharacterized protein LOC123318703 [Coccinella septempunctata]
MSKNVMFSAVIVLVGALVFFQFVGVSSKGCSLPLRAADEEHMPVLVDNSTSKYKLIIPDKGNVILSKDERIILLCPSYRNTLAITNTNSSVITCVNEQTIKILKKNEDFQKVVCSKGVRGATMSTNTKCANGQGRIIKIGFPVERGQFLTLIETCYDGKNGNALYSSHVLIGSEMDYASKSNFRPPFSTEGLGPGVSADVAYKQTYEKATFNSVLGSAKLAAQYINKSSYLARGHLAPDADFLFASWQYATFFYINTVPQWQAINNGNWKRLEYLVRDTAAFYGEDLEVHTGSYKVLQLPDVNEAPTNIFLVSKSKLAVPRFMWKIIYSKKSRKAIAFVALNNPFVTRLGTKDKLCTNICNRYGWDRSAWMDGSKGFIYCCDARDLLQVIGIGPKLDVRGVLDAPNLSNRFYDF